MVIPSVLSKQRAFFMTQCTKEYDFRLEQLKKLEHAIKLYEEELYTAFWKDLRKSRFEVYSTEIGFVLQSIRETKRQLKRWMAPEKVKNPLHLKGSSSYTIAEPYGTILIIGPFNYPFQLVIEPLIGAISAGNTAIIKPSELTPSVASVIKKIISETFNDEYLSVILGGVEYTTALLAEKFDHIFFTGSPRVGKIVMEAASKHLTPVTLELGGKSPVIVTDSAQKKEAAQKITWAKFLNTGQTCVAPDYIYVEESIASEFIEELRHSIDKFYGNKPFDSKDYGRLATVRHTERLVSLLSETNGSILIGGESEVPSRYLAPTVVRIDNWEDALMKEEIFGPILPILIFKKEKFESDVLQTIRHYEKPLALYLFTKDKEIEKRVIKTIPFGGGVINDTILHLSNPHLPFGGVGQSGMGNYHGRYSFYTFSHKKAIVKKSRWPNLSFLYPAYSEKKMAFIKKIMR